MEAELTFGKWLKRRRRALDKTQKELAQQVGCALITIQKLEADEREPSKELAERLALCLEIAPDQRAQFIAFARAKPYLDLISPPAISTDSTEIENKADWQKGSSPPPIPLPPFLAQETSPEAPSTVFVARERELAELAATLDTVRAGQGQLLFVIGGAGRGKTLLVQEFARRAQVADPDLIVVSGNCNAYTGLGDPYLPFRELLGMLTGEVEAKWAGRLISREHASRLWNLIPITIAALVEHAPDLIGSFLPAKALQARASTVASKDAAWFTQLTAFAAAADLEAKLEQPTLFAQYTTFLRAIAPQRPLLLILEDLHWIDSASSGLLFHLSRQVSDSRVLIVGTYRPDEVVLSGDSERHPLAGMMSELKRRHGDIWLDLGNLAPIEGRRFVEAYLDTQPNRLDGGFRERLFQQTGGHALFTVELLGEMQERGDLCQDGDGYWHEGETIDWQSLPAKVEGVIERRINRLTEELQTILTVASIEGETFTAEVVARVQQLNERELVRQLSQTLDKQHRLVTAQALERVAGQRLSLYRFRHHLFQHYLYHHLAEMERVYLHEAVGNALESLYGNQTEQAAVQLARHFEQAGLTTKAVEYLLQAGKQAVQLSANKEAIAHLTQGLTLLKTQQTSTERIQQELNLHLALGVAVAATKGYGSPEAEKIYLRAQALGQQVGEISQLFPAIYGLRQYYLLHGQMQKAHELAEQLLQLAQTAQEPDLLLEAHRAMGVVLFHLGRPVSAQRHLEQGIVLYDAQQHRSHAFLYGHDPGASCFVYAASNLWLLGYPDQSLARSQEIFQLVQDELSHPFSLAFTLAFGSWTYVFRREIQVPQERAEAAISLSTERGFPLWLGLALILQGWALVEQGQEERGIAQLRQGLETWGTTGAEMLQPHWLALLAEAYGKAGQTEAALTTLDEALTLAKKTGEGWWDAELYRLKGELLLKNEDRRLKAEESPEAYFLKAIEIAQRQSAKSLELRAVMSLSRLWHSQGAPDKKEEAQQMLAEIYGWFSEGFDTADLKEAKDLLEALAQPGAAI